MLRYQAVKYFTVIARCQSITRAAEQLYLSQSGLSAHIRNLERELGVSLLERTNRNVRLTPAGQALYDWAAPFFDGEEAAVQAARRAGIGEADRVAVGTVGANITYFLADIIQRFRAQYGGIRVDMRRMNMDPLNEAIRSGAVDLGFQIVSGPVPPEYESHIVEQGRLVLAVHKSSPLAGRTSVSYGDLRGVPIGCLTVSSAAHPRDSLLQRCSELGFRPDIAVEMEYVEPLLTLVNMGICATVTSSLAPLGGLENVRYISLEDSDPIDLAVVWRKDLRSPAARLFLRHVLDSAPIERAAAE